MPNTSTYGIYRVRIYRGGGVSGVVKNGGILKWVQRIRVIVMFGIGALLGLGLGLGIGMGSGRGR